MTTTIDLNADMGESFGAWTIGDGVDPDIMPLISSANIAAGFHAGDPSTMVETLRLASRHGVSVGVHPGFRDLVGFGRRPILAPADELVNDALYQLGAFRELACLEGLEVNHFKLHGALFMHAAQVECPRFLDTSKPHTKAVSKASGLKPPRWLWRRFRL